MDRIGPRLPNTSSRLIAMAASLVDSAEQVRVEMGCTPEDFREYCAGHKEPPMPEFDRLITLIVREQGRMIAQNRELIAKVRRHLGNSGTEP
jgi:hypothetical protein